MKVCIIGAGYAGLVSLRHLKDFLNNPQEDLVAYERQGEVGGLWNYDPRTETDEFGLPIHGAIYSTLRTNFPRNIMDFPDFHNHKKGPSFMQHTEVLQFLKDYATHFHLYQYIKFQHFIEEVRPTEGGQWSVRVRDLKTTVVSHTLFDKVFICNGHFSTPSLPSELDFSQFENQTRIFHSKNYRTPELFKNKRVAVLGAGPSGVDISTDIAKQGGHTQLFLCHSKDRSPIVFPPNLEQRGRMVGVGRDWVEVEVGGEGAKGRTERVQDVDVIIICTGYDYSAPFLRDVNLHLARNEVGPLFKDVCHLDYVDSLFLVGLQRKVAMGYMIDSQVRLILAILQGSLTLKEVDAEINKERQREKNDPLLKSTKLGVRFRDYMVDLARLAKIPEKYRIPEVVLQIFEDVISHKDVCALREHDYHIVGEGKNAIFEKKRRQANPNSNPNTNPKEDNMIINNNNTALNLLDLNKMLDR